MASFAVAWEGKKKTERKIRHRISSNAKADRLTDAVALRATGIVTSQIRRLEMSVLSSVLISIAIIDCLVTIGLLLMWLKGMSVIVVHKFVIQTPILIIALILIDMVIVILAMVASRQSASSNQFTMTNVF